MLNLSKANPRNESRDQYQAGCNAAKPLMVS